MIKSNEEFIIQEKAGKEIRRFKKIKSIGKGGFAEVYQCLDSKTNAEVAVKVMNREKIAKINGAREKLMSEVSIHKTLDHPNVVRFEEFFEDHYHYYIVLELCSDENLETVLRKEDRFSSELTRHYIRQLIHALIYLRDKSIIHRDLKLANLFVKEGRSIKLGDFGLACRHENPNRKRKSVCGTPNYIAPEMLSGDGHSFPVDVWAVGILLFAMLIGKPPFETTNMKMTYNRIQSCMYVFPPDRQIETSAKVLIQNILSKNPAKRPSLEDVLNSEFFRQGQPPVEAPPAPPQRSEQMQSSVSDSLQNSVASVPTLHGVGFAQPLLMHKASHSQASLSQAEDRSAVPPLQLPAPEESPTKQPRAEDKPTRYERQVFYRKMFNHDQRPKPADPGRHAYSHRDPDPAKKEPARPGPHAEKKEPEPAFLKRIISNMSSAAHHDPLGELPAPPPSEDPPESRRGALPDPAPGLHKTSSTYSFKPKDLGLVRDAPPDLAASQLLEEQDPATTPKPQPRRINAFEILKNTSKLNSMTNSVIHDPAESPAKPLPSKAPPAPAHPDPPHSSRNLQARRDRDKQLHADDKARDHSASSTTSNNKRLFFQRMITNNEVSKDLAKKPAQDPQLSKETGNQPEEFKLSLQPQHPPEMDRPKRSSSMKPSEPDSKLFRTLLESGGPKPEPAEQPRPSSAQPNLKVRPLWLREETGEEESFDPKDYIKKWVDHSSKYGLVFIMNSGTMGILFNDFSKILFKLRSEKFVYLAKNHSKKREEVNIYAVEFPPKQIEKKVKIMVEIRKNFLAQEKELGLPAEAAGALESVKDKVYLKNWVKAKQAIIFKLSSLVYQAVFQDKSEVLLSSKLPSVLYIDKDRKRHHYTLNSEEIQQHRSISVRIEYFKKVLRKWVERDSNTTHTASVSKINHELDV